MNARLSIVSLAMLAATALAPRPAHAFCGFYVGKAGAELYNHASKVVLARDGKRTVLTMNNDFEGNMKDFALVVPVPTVLVKDQIHIGDRHFVDRIDNYSAPRLVEYFDEDPCSPREYEREEKAAAVKEDAAPAPRKASNKTLGVRVEAEYTVGEYDIVILSAKESDGLQTWLVQQGYQIPPKAAAALEPYIKQNMKFFVARVNLKEQKSTGVTYLRPIQIAYESEKFMLPIRLGMANAKGAQDLLVYTLTPHGRVESANYKTVNMPSDVEVPLYVKDVFGKFYADTFQQAHKQSDYRAVHTEYVWNSAWCDPCADNPLTPEELHGLGVFWLDQSGSNAPIITRLHVRYDAEHFPEDLVFQETGDQQNFQARYILRHPFKGNLACEAGREYLKSLDARHGQERDTLATLTGWDKAAIMKAMGDDAPGHIPSEEPWYKRMWK
ncbi:MAG: DUF2330 domain-containing protein [Deltaproteobacteria bacterium]|nr:DUF2330 domain-containing protein [Deltaproteobacteria bacterium]